MSEISQVLKAVQHPIRREILSILEGSKKGTAYSLLLPICEGATGKLNYHLRALEGLLEKDDANYKITAKGRLVLHWIRKIEESEEKANDHPVVGFLKVFPAQSQLKKMYAEFVITFPLKVLFGTFIAALYLFLIGFSLTMASARYELLASFSGIPLEIISWIYLVGVIVSFVGGLALTKPYFSSIWYQITDTEVIVHKGIFVSTVKIVPYRTITNIEAKRGWIERRFGVSSLHISTAGKAIPEEKLVGFVEPDEMKETILSNVRLLNPPGFDKDNTNELRKLIAVLEQMRSNNMLLEKMN